MSDHPENAAPPTGLSGAGGSLPVSDLATKYASEVQTLADIIVGGECVPASFREVESLLRDLKQDEIRLAWLEKNLATVEIGMRTGCKCGSCRSWQVTAERSTKINGEDEYSLRAAIDAAMSEANTPLSNSGAGEPNNET